MPTATLTSKGQVTIPKDVRDKLGLKQGDELLFTAQPDGSIRILPRNLDVRALKSILPRPSRTVTIEEMNQAILDEAAERDLRTLSPDNPRRRLLASHGKRAKARSA